MIEIPQSYSIPLVILSILTSCVASYTAVSLNERIGKNSLIGPSAWMIMASLAMGLGIWAMHFIGMYALQVPIAIHHNYSLTALSIIPAMIASFLALYVANQPRVNRRMIGIASICMGFGIITMHYMGMAAMTPEAGIEARYDLKLVIASCIAALFISLIGLYLLSHVSRRSVFPTYAKIITALLLGFATAAAHYIGMASLHLVRTEMPATMPPMAHHDIEFLIIGISISLAIIFSLLITASVVDHHLERRIIYYDALTHLPNRRHFLRKIRANGQIKAIALIKFPYLLNYHHEFNFELEDDVVQLISNRLKESMPPYTKLYRIDEQSFVFIAKDDQAAIELKEHLELIQQRLRHTLTLNGKEIKIVGTATFAMNEHDETYEQMFLNVQAAMDHPSTYHKDFSIIPYDDSQHIRNFASQLVEGLEDALENGEIFLMYQPKVSTKKKAIAGVEALIRWHHPVYGILSPAIFLPILEANYKMFYLTDWIIEQVCSMLQTNQQHPHNPMYVSINIPGNYLTSPRLKDTLIRMTNAYNIAPSQIELEITETSFIKELDKAEDIVKMYRMLGFSVALDDFGTGVSSLAYLKSIPITTLKIDKSFIDDVPLNEKDTLILQSMLQLAESLNVEVVLEGVETKTQLDFLIHACKAPIIQGYYYSKPLPIDEFLVWHEQFKGHLLIQPS